MEVVQERANALYSLGKHVIEIAWNFTAAIGKEALLREWLTNCGRLF